MRMISILVFGLACRAQEKNPSNELEGEFLLDEDSDGFIAAEDCDDTNANINPEAEEILGADSTYVRIFS